MWLSSLDMRITGAHPLKSMEKGLSTLKSGLKYYCNFTIRGGCILVTVECIFGINVLILALWN